MRELVRHPQHSRRLGLGSLAVSWIEFFCLHGPGDIMHAPLDPTLPGAYPMDDEFAGFIMDAYACDETGRRLYSSAFVSRPKGRAKSELAGWIALFEALGPCRVSRDSFGAPRIAVEGDTFVVGDFVYEYEEGEFLAEPVTYPYIRCLATEEGQSGNTFDNIYENLRASVRLHDAYGINPRVGIGTTGIKLPTGGEIIPSTASGSAKDGGKETFVVFDETHLYTLPELHRMYRTVSRNLAKRKAAEPWGLETSTMYAPGENSIAEQTHDQARRVREGKARITNVLFDHRQAPANIDMADPAAVRAGLVEAYGPASEWMDMESLVAQFYDTRNPVAESRRYFFNQPTSTSDAWLNAVDWQRAAAGPEVREVAPGETITLGFDGSQKRATGIADATALIGCRVSDGALFVIGVWEQPEGPEGIGWEVPVDDVHAAVDEAFATYDVAAFYADPPYWNDQVVGWEARYGALLAVKAVNDHPISWWTNRTGLMGRALDLFEEAVRDVGLVHFSEDVLTRHILNAKRRPRRGSMGIGKEHNKSAKKIDAAMAATLAFQARADVVAAGATAKRRRPTEFVRIRRR